MRKKSYIRIDNVREVPLEILKDTYRSDGLCIMLAEASFNTLRNLVGNLQDQRPLHLALPKPSRVDAGVQTSGSGVSPNISAAGELGMNSELSEMVEQMTALDAH